MTDTIFLHINEHTLAVQYFKRFVVVVVALLVMIKLTCFLITNESSENEQKKKKKRNEMRCDSFCNWMRQFYIMFIVHYFESARYHITAILKEHYREVFIH